MYHYVYRAEHLPTSRFYVGVRSCTQMPYDDPYLGSGVYWSDIVKAHPREEFYKLVLGIFPTREAAYTAEKITVSQIRGRLGCLNRTNGGEGGSGRGIGWKHTEESKKKIAESLRGKKFPNKREGKPHSEESKAKISKALTGKTRPFNWKYSIKRCKLSEEDQLEVKRLYSTGEYTQQQLAAIYGVTQPIIFRAIHRTVESFGGKIVLSPTTRPKRKVECEYCGKVMGVNMYGRWHKDGKCQKGKTNESLSRV